MIYDMGLNQHAMMHDNIQCTVLQYNPYMKGTEGVCVRGVCVCGGSGDDIYVTFQ